MDHNHSCSVNWLTVPAPDLNAARQFYSEVFGFAVEPFSPRFLVFRTANLSGGFDQDLPPSEHGIGFSITVPSLGQYVEKIRHRGCDILKEPDQLGPNTGFCAKFKDPNGNVIELYSEVE